MVKKTPLILLKIGLVTALAIMISGCGTEDPWSPDPSRPLDLSMVSGPADTVAYGSDISFSWTSTGGTGEVQYQYRRDSGSWSILSNLTSVIHEDLTNAGADPLAVTFDVRAEDAANDADTVSQTFWIDIAPPADATPPTAWIISSPAEGSFVAAGSNITFTWDGDDPEDGDNVVFWYSWLGVVSDTSTSRTVTLTNVAAADPAVFSLWAMDNSGNDSDSASVSFVTKDATILYVDDYLWSAPATERDQKQFYRDVLEGYAFAEWDIALQGMPDSAYVLNFSTIIWASDSDVGDADGTWWYEIGDPGESSLHYFMDNGGHLLAAGANILQWIYNSNPPAPGDFEYDWLGLNDTDGWDYWDDFTWAVSAGNYAGIPDSMKIDVGKNGDQVDYAEDIFGFRDSTVILFTKGLDIYGEEPYDYGISVGHIFYPGGGSAISAMINFDVYSMPLAGMRATFGVVLTEFGE